MPREDDRRLLNTHQPLYADVIVPRHIARAFTYLVPPALKETLAIGHRVLVPFGRATLEAAVISLSDRPPAGVNVQHLREICSLTHGRGDADPSSALFELSRKISDHYVAPWGQCLRLIFPSRPTQRVATARYIATDEGRAALKAETCPEHLRPLLERIARRSTGVQLSTLQDSAAQSGRRVMAALEKNSWIAFVEPKMKEAAAAKRSKRSTGDPIEPGNSSDPHIFPAPVLPEADPMLVDRMASGMQSSQSKRIVVHAPWEHRVSLLSRAVQQAHSIGKSVIIISGEVAKAEWLRHLLSSITKLSISEQPSSELDLQQIKEATASIIVGPRSAIFTPVKAIGLIWVEEEDDPALKEPKEPRYHARDVACMRGEIERALVVLASSHPSLESQTDKAAEVYAIRELPARRPSIELVDLRDAPGGMPLSQELIAAIQHAVAHKSGALLFLNRKGYAGALVCRECGWVPRCPSCALAFPYSREASTLVCRYCGATEALPDSCPTCRASRLTPVGEGTERIEVEARRLLPSARIARFDGDTLRRPAAARALWEKIRSGGFDIVIGTQAVFQREPLPQMGLVGIVHADSGLHVPDFRAAERTYQLLVDAVSVARSASEGGRVILQTWLPTHHAVESIVSGDPSRFYNEELAARRLLGYPPVRHLVSLSVSGRDRRLVERAAQQWRTELEQSLSGQGSIMILGPVPAMAGRPRGLYRDQMLLKGDDRTGLRRAVRDTVTGMENKYRTGRMKFIIDVDPVEML